jgi:hypothetical protein
VRFAHPAANGKAISEGSNVVIVRTMNGYVSQLPGEGKADSVDNPLRGIKRVSQSGRGRFSHACQLRDLFRPVVTEREHQDLLVDLVVAFEALHRAAAGVC